MLPTIIIDNFFPDPTSVRNYALSIEHWHKDDGLTWPGIRTNSIHTFNQEYHDALAWNIYNSLPRHITLKYNGFSKFYGMFHIVGQEYGSGWVHDDGTDLDFAGLVYLNPKAPKDSGTSIYHMITDKLEHFGDEERIIKKKFLANPEMKDEYTDLQNKRASQFIEVTSTQNVYNRCIIYDAYAWHCAGKYFGTTKEDSRLTLVFFGKFGNGQTDTQ